MPTAYACDVKTDAEFELWLDEFEQRISEIARRWTWRMGAIIVSYFAAMTALIVIVVDR